MKKKRLIAGFLAAVLMTASVSAVQPVETQRVRNTIRFNGDEIRMDAYAIDNYTYFKLRDVAMLFDDTDASFAVGYDADTRTIRLTTRSDYEPVGGELAEDAEKTAMAVQATQTVLVDGEPVSLQAYAIGGYTYFKIRDLAEAVRFSVRWENAGIGMETNEYTAQRDAERILALVNEARASVGVAPLVMTETLCERAFVRAYEQPQQRGHTRPNGSSCFSVLDGLEFKRAGENVAGGQETPEEVMQDWMSSEGHRKNILDPKFTEIGVGLYQDSWSQLFMG